MELDWHDILTAMVQDQSASRERSGTRQFEITLRPGPSYIGRQGRQSNAGSMDEEHPFEEDTMSGNDLEEDTPEGYGLDQHLWEAYVSGDLYPDESDSVTVVSSVDSDAGEDESEAVRSPQIDRLEFDLANCIPSKYVLKRCGSIVPDQAMMICTGDSKYWYDLERMYQIQAKVFYYAMIVEMIQDLSGCNPLTMSASKSDLPPFRSMIETSSVFQVGNIRNLRDDWIMANKEYPARCEGHVMQHFSKNFKRSTTSGLFARLRGLKPDGRLIAEMCCSVPSYPCQNLLPHRIGSRDRLRLKKDICLAGRDRRNYQRRLLKEAYQVQADGKTVEPGKEYSLYVRYRTCALIEQKLVQAWNSWDRFDWEGGNYRNILESEFGLRLHRPKDGVSLTDEVPRKYKHTSVSTEDSLQMARWRATRPSDLWNCFQERERVGLCRPPGSMGFR